MRNASWIREPQKPERVIGGLQRHSVQTLQRRGNILQGTNQVERALADDSEAIRLMPRDAYCLHSRGLMMRALGRDAEADIAKAKEVEPGIGP